MAGPGRPGPRKDPWGPVKSMVLGIMKPKPKPQRRDVLQTPVSNKGARRMRRKQEL
jgi:hypothetical protein